MPKITSILLMACQEAGETRFGSKKPIYYDKILSIVDLPCVTDRIIKSASLLITIKQMQLHTSTVFLNSDFSIKYGDKTKMPFRDFVLFIVNN